MSKNLYFPCILVEHENNRYSIICSDFHLFDDYFGDKEAGGYSIQRLAKKLAKENNIGKEIKYDSEAGMFCAYSEDKDKLLQLCNLLQKITGKEDEHIPKENTKPLISLDEAEKLLLKGFVISLDKEAQEIFYENVPIPQLSKKQKQYIEAIQNGTDEEAIKAAKKINSEARTKTRDWNNYLSHPETISIFLNAIDKTTTPKVYQELIWAVVFICSRHLPDLRTRPYFLKALENKNATLRWLGLMGLEEIYVRSEADILKIKEDRSKKVRDKAEEVLRFCNKKVEFASWMFNPKNY